MGLNPVPYFSWTLYHYRALSTFARCRYQSFAASRRYILYPSAVQFENVVFGVLSGVMNRSVTKFYSISLNLTDCSFWLCTNIVRA